MLTNILALVVGLAAGGGAVYILLQAQFQNQLKSSEGRHEREREEMLEVARKEAEQLKKQAVLEAKETLQEERKTFEKEIRQQRNEVVELEKRILRKEETLDRKIQNAEAREVTLDQKRKELEANIEKLHAKDREYDELKVQVQAKLEQVSGLTREEAKRQLISAMEEDARADGAQFARKIVDEATETAEEKAKYIIANCIQRVASEYVAETTVSVIDLPSEDMKGRIIGREGRNIRALEQATGIDLIIDDTPECVILSGFDPVKRYIAGEAVKKLLTDGRIHPARIEETVAKIRRETQKNIRELGKAAAFEVGIHGLHEDIINMMGRLNFRKSYSQNVLRHSVEVSFICGMIAAELGANVKIARRAGFLHDIGKAMDHEIEGPHAVIGAEFCKKLGESQEVVHAIGAHHYDWEPATIEALIVITADALSAARPGARREVLQNYIKRLEELETVSASFPGVEKAYAIQAGREIRVIVEPNAITDGEMSVLARDIAKKIETEMQYPGEIKITVIRETRTVEYAR